MDQPDLLKDDPTFTFVKKLGRGSFGVVCLYKWRGSRLNPGTEMLVAVKFISREGVDYRYLALEVQNHRTLEHPHVIACYKIGLTPSKTHVYMVMEFADHGDLFSYINARHTVTPGGMSEDEARWFFHQLILGLDYCHKKSVVNRDLKLDNLLLVNALRQPTTPGQVLQPTFLHVKISDFGLCRRADTSQPKSRVGTLYYMAPEVLEATNQQRYSGEKADIWSAGVVLYVLLFKRYPFGTLVDKNDQGQRRSVMSNIRTVSWQVPPDVPVSPACADFLQRILVRNPAQRMSLADIVTHEWFMVGLPPTMLGPGFLEFNDRMISDQAASQDPQEQTDAEVAQVLAEAETLMHSGAGAGGAGGVGAAGAGGMSVANGTVAGPHHHGAGGHGGGGMGTDDLGSHFGETELIDEQFDLLQEEHPSMFMPQTR